MSAPTPAPAPPEGRPLVPRLLVVVAFVAVGFVAIWQGFGAAGYGTDLHTKRVSWTCFQLFAGGFVAVALRGWFSVRVFAALVFFASAASAWWEIRSSNFKSAISLREAVAERDRLRSALAKPGDADPWNTLEAAGRYQFLQAHYPSLLDPLRADYARWAEGGVAALRDRYRQTAPGDIKGVIKLREYAVGLDDASPGAFEIFKADEREWVARSVKASTDELAALPRDWAEFDRTAPGRKALAEAFPEARPALVATEEEWAGGVVEGLVGRNLKSATPTPWRDAEKQLLARPALDPGDGRFKEARRRLFKLAHDAAKAEATAHLDAGRYAAAFGLARKHAVEWNAAAVALGEPYVKDLDELRARCEELAKLHADPVEVAPPPRPRP